MTSVTPTIVRKIVLIKSTDWDVWISFVRSRTENSEIWELVNSNLETKSIDLQRSINSSFNVSTRASEIDKDAYDLYKIQSHVYKTSLVEYEREKKVLSKLNSFIRKSLAIQNAMYIQKIDSHLWNVLRALKQRLAFTNTICSLEIERKYHQLCKRSERQEIEKWIENWQTTYADAKTYNVTEISETRSQRDFLLTVYSKESNFSNTELVKLNRNESEDLNTLIEDFRILIRLRAFRKEKNSLIAFVTNRKLSDDDKNKNKDNSQNEISFDERKSTRDCLCEMKHSWKNCYYLIETKRSNEWISRFETMKKIENAYAKSKWLKSKMKKVIKVK